VPCAASHTGQQNHGSMCTRLVPMTKTVGVQHLIGKRLALPLHSNAAKCGSRNNPMLPLRFGSTGFDRGRRHPTTCQRGPYTTHAVRAAGMALAASRKAGRGAWRAAGQGAGEFDVTRAPSL
jgi:hypothetical protein